MNAARLLLQVVKYAAAVLLGDFRLLVEKHHDSLIRVLYLFSDNCVKGVIVFLNLLVYFIVL